MEKLVVRTSLTVALPFILIFVFVVELLRGIKLTLRYAYLAVRMNIDSYGECMRREDF